MHARADPDADRADVPQELHRARVCLLLHQHGWSPQIPARRVVQRDDEAVATWVSV
ncbi:winged helix-turn-helix domain-containing protein [Streptomyces sp. NPDC058122]|uniref:winged helix-turn-helix domain-containing protein n=1 Tax=Streptomyces sp. NPDC058122 TaxID=3346349 RepID=UPI0036EBD295